MVFSCLQFCKPNFTMKITQSFLTQNNDIFHILYTQICWCYQPIFALSASTLWFLCNLLPCVIIFFIMTNKQRVISSWRHTLVVVQNIWPFNSLHKGRHLIYQMVIQLRITSLNLTAASQSYFSSIEDTIMWNARSPQQKHSWEERINRGWGGGVREIHSRRIHIHWWCARCTPASCPSCGTSQIDVRGIKMRRASSGGS